MIRRCKHCGHELTRYPMGQKVNRMGYNYRQFAREFGFTHGQIAYWFSRNCKPKRPQLARLRFIFGERLYDD